MLMMEQVQMDQSPPHTTIIFVNFCKLVMGFAGNSLSPLQVDYAFLSFPSLILLLVSSPLTADWTNADCCRSLWGRVRCHSSLLFTLHIMALMVCAFLYTLWKCWALAQRTYSAQGGGGPVWSKREGLNVYTFAMYVYLSICCHFPSILLTQEARKNVSFLLMRRRNSHWARLWDAGCTDSLQNSETSHAGKTVGERIRLQNRSRDWWQHWWNLHSWLNWQLYGSWNWNGFVWVFGPLLRGDPDANIGIIYMSAWYPHCLIFKDLIAYFPCNKKGKGRTASRGREG